MDKKSNLSSHTGSHHSNHSHPKKHIDHHIEDAQAIRVISKDSKISTEFNHATYNHLPKKDDMGIGKKK
ncbi:MAG: hypothetical protein HC932_00905 [Thermales bacterium]|nr:hypothetical protein [Thermales bacterium]